MMDTETPAAHVPFNTTAPMEVTSGGGNWAAFYFLAAYGGVAYFITFASFPLLYVYVKRGNLWNPLKVKQVGLTQLAVVGGFSWYLYNLILEVLPDEAQQKLLPANTATCWFRHFWIITCVCLFSNSILLKQYRSYVRYVARESLAPPYSHFTIASVPYFILALLPFWNGYDSTHDTCERDSIASLLLYVWMCIVFIACMCLLNTLRDTCTYYPNLQASFAEVIGFLVLTLVRAYEIWFTCSDCLSSFTRSYISAFLLVTIPNAVFWIVLGRSLWKVHTGDLEYCRELERLCSPTSHLISHTQDDDDEQQINDPHMEGSLPQSDSQAQQAPRMRPNYSKGNRGEFFETDRLTALISSGDNSEVKSFILETNLNLIHILDREGFAPLHRAVLAGSEDLVNFLLEMNCDPNFPSREGDRAIHFAARQGEMGIVSLLHGANADVNAVSHRGITPLHYAVLSSSSDAVRTFLDRGAMPTIPHQEASSESWEKVHILDAGRMKNYWKRPLTLAVELGLSSAVSLMVHAQPSSLDYSCAHSLTYLMMSIALGHKSVAEALLNAGADVWKICNRRKRNVLHYNAMQGSRTIFQLLKDWFLTTDPPERPTAADTPGSPKPFAPRSPSVHVRQSECSDMASDTSPHDRSGSLGMLPVDIGGALSMTSSGPMPSDKSLMSQVHSTDAVPKIAWPVSEPGSPADPSQLLAVFLSMPDCFGRSPLHYAVLKGHLELVTLLVAQGADTRLRDIPCPDRGYMGFTPGEYLQEQLHNSPHLSSAERAKFHKAWTALQQAPSPQ